MAINKLSSFCLNNYDFDNYGHCQNCFATCYNNCKFCLEKVHFHEIERNYDCQNMVYCYSCSYIYKYASELVHLFKEYKFNFDREINILSLGCGPCPDLFAISKLYPGIRIHYTGIDFNPLWKPIHEYIQSDIFPFYELMFAYENVIDYLSFLNKNPAEDVYDFVIIQYLVNELVHTKLISQFEQEFVKFAGTPKSRLIIFNDINHDKVRSPIAQITKSLSLFTPNTRFNDWRFAKPYSHTFGGNKHKDDSIVFDIDETVQTQFLIKSECTSYQKIIKT